MFDDDDYDYDDCELLLLTYYSSSSYADYFFTSYKSIL